jgi:nonsense-mediated mRNA decay protein 3
MLMTLYCPTCNRSSDECRFIGDFCEYCIAARLKRKMPEMVKVYQCRFCKRMKVGNTFLGDGEDDMKALGKAIRVALRMGEDSKVRVNEYTNWGMARCMIQMQYEGQRIDFDANMRVKMLHETCQRCYRMSAGYYQAVMQLRGNRVKMDKLVSKIEWFMKKNGGFVTKIVDEENGVDVYVSDKEIAASFFVYVRLKPTKSFRLFGVKRGKKVYRNTYAVHL